MSLGTCIQDADSFRCTRVGAPSQSWSAARAIAHNHWQLPKGSSCSNTDEPRMNASFGTPKLLQVAGACSAASTSAFGSPRSLPSMHHSSAVRSAAVAAQYRSALEASTTSTPVFPPENKEVSTEWHVHLVRQVSEQLLRSSPPQIIRIFARSIRVI